MSGEKTLANKMRMKDVFSLASKLLGTVNAYHTHCRVPFFVHSVKDAYHRETNEDCREQPDHKLEMSTGQLKKYMWGQKIKKWQEILKNWRKTKLS